MSSEVWWASVGSGRWNRYGVAVIEELGARQRSAVVSAILAWFDEHQRDLPWRGPEVDAWAIMVSEFMLQQTPVARVLGPWRDWLERWPTPAALADAPAGEAVRAWGRLGYPRRALRLHAAAVAITERHDGLVPSDIDELRALPGVGDYTAAAIASFAHGQRRVVLDTNVRRVLARIDRGQAHPSTAPTRAEVVMAEQWLPRTRERAARWAAASMELGALVCTARAPQCEVCPVRTRCRWYASGRPAHDGPPRVGQRYEGTDRQCRGALLAVLRSHDTPVAGAELLEVWPDHDQAVRALAGLVSDGLAAQLADDHYVLPG